MKRTLAKQTLEKIGQEVTLKGWVNSRRDLGKLIFVDLRDRSGIVQVVCDKQAKNIRPEYVVEIKGKVTRRELNFINEELETGIVEVKAQEIKVLNKAVTPPFDIYGDGYDIDESIRLRNRYLDLRRPRLVKNLKTRYKVIRFMRDYLHKHDFTEIETPILTKTTPEGARDFIVPSRLQKGKFYALPQSPQQYKQLLMVAGYERYFQIARCFRDEDPRADRAYGEFTQLDMEMSFVEQDDILRLTEDLFTKIVQNIFPGKKITQKPWPRLPYKEVMEKYGTDKPDIRVDKKDKNELAFVWVVDFPLFTKQSEEDFYHGLGKAKYAPSHHMFTAPHPNDLTFLDSDPLKVRGLQHDMVLNGYEVGGGSVRIHETAVQEKVFNLIGFTEDQKKQFAHLLNAFLYGAPPHGGIAPGIDRFLFVLLGERSLREVMAFPATASGGISVMVAPSEASKGQLKELGLKI